MSAAQWRRAMNTGAGRYAWAPAGAARTEAALRGIATIIEAPRSAA